MIIGCHNYRQLYEFIRRKRGVGTEPPVLIDSSDLLQEPELYMENYCRMVQVEFRPEMLRWEAGEQEHFKKWPVSCESL